MDRDSVLRIYSGTMASTYDETWHGGVWGPVSHQLERAIDRRIRADTRWLDVGCGTGYYLSHHPHTTRAGLDLSPEMLALARAANPTAVFREGDIRSDVPEWHDRWTLITSTGEAWSYVDSMFEIDAIVERLARWTAPDGCCLIGIQDAKDLTGLDLPFRGSGEPGFKGHFVVEGVIWSVVADEDPHHPHLIWPSLDYWILLFARSFRRIEVETLPHDPPFMFTPHRVLVASQKREPGDDRDAEIVHSRPDGYAPHEIDPPARPLRDITVGELLDRARPWTASFWRSLAARARGRDRE